MAADPIAAAQQLAGQTYATAKDRSAAGKQALLDQLSTQGTYNNALDAQSTAQAAPGASQAPPPVQGDPALVALAQHGALQIQAANQQAISAASALAAQQRSQQQAAAGTYFDQVGAAVPIEQSRASSDAANILADLQAKRDAQAAAQAQAKIQLQIEQEQLAQAREAHSAASAASALFSSPNQALAFKTAAEQQAASPITALAGTDAKGNPVSTPALAAAQYLTDHPGSTLSDIVGKYNLAPDEQQQVADAVNLYHSNLSQVGYYQNLGLPVPAAVTLPKSASYLKSIGFHTGF